MVKFAEKSSKDSKKGGKGGKGGKGDKDHGDYATVKKDFNQPIRNTMTTTIASSPPTSPSVNSPLLDNMSPPTSPAP